MLRDPLRAGDDTVLIDDGDVEPLAGADVDAAPVMEFRGMQVLRGPG
jgi:hypothetical protein